MGRSRGLSDRKNNINRRAKVHLVFDADARREFLSGFHSRKLQRQEKAKKDIQQQLKEEKKRVKTQARNTYRELVNSHKPVPHLEELQSEEIQLENHCVSICELSTAEISLKNKWIGINQVQNGDTAEAHPEKSDVMVPGTFHTKKDLKKALKKQAASNFKKSELIQRKNKKESRKRTSAKCTFKKSKMKSSKKKEK